MSLRGTDLRLTEANQTETAARDVCFLSPLVSSESCRWRHPERGAAASFLKSVLSHLPSARIYVSSFNFLPKPQAPDSLLYFQRKASRGQKRSLRADYRGEVITNGLMGVWDGILQCPTAGWRNGYSSSPTGFPPLFNNGSTQKHSMKR